MNLKKETIKELSDNGKDISDIVWVGCQNAKIPIDLFWQLADKEYDSGYGAAEVATDLVVVGNGWWLERGEYDGSEWWEFKTAPTEPTKTINVNSIMGGMWDSLLSLNNREEELE